MAKLKHSTSPDNTPETVVSEPAVAETPAAETAPAVAATSTEIEVDAHPDSLANLIPVLPHKRDTLLSIRKVHPEEFEAILGNLPADLQENFKNFLKRMNPVRESREMGEASFRPNTLRLYQGVGEKPKNPKLPKGGVEDGSGNIMLVPEAFKEDFEGIPQKIRVSILFMSIGRAYWPARGKDGQPEVPPGLDIKGNQMICGSNDRVIGSRYGKCSDCPYKPSFDSKTKACKDNIDLFAVTPDLTAIYQITLGATSFKSAGKIISDRAGSWEKDYFGQFDLAPLLVEKTGQSYYVWTATPVTSRAMPNGVLNSPEVNAVMDLMVRQIRTEVYFPRLAAVYARSGTAESNPAGSISDVENAAGGVDHAESNNINA